MTAEQGIHDVRLSPSGVALRSRATSNIGIVRLSALQAWAIDARNALDATVLLFGSSLDRKDWRDLDVALQWPVVPWRGNTTWLFLSAAMSHHASAFVNAPVEVHLHSEPWHSDVECLALAVADGRALPQEADCG